jgi:hypothetical protein
MRSNLESFTFSNYFKDRFRLIGNNDKNETFISKGASSAKNYFSKYKIRELKEMLKWVYINESLFAYILRFLASSKKGKIKKCFTIFFHFYVCVCSVCTVVCIILQTFKI